MRLIDADALIEKIECLFKNLNSTEDFMGIGYNHGVGDCIAIIKNAPTIEPVKTGKWETDELPMGCVVGYWCSECGEQHDYKTPYCPNCGAKMEGAEE
ncbi:MAG: hypothetical protein IKF99_08505 [Oscillospiraceae bacterium]|nr:hypothetical protein [Oscillospiraceae bacterium]